MTIIIFGITGDLARRKLIPALCRLIEHKKLTSFLIIGAGREATSKEEIMGRSSEFLGSVPAEIKEMFINSFVYQMVDVCDGESFSAFAQFVQHAEQSRNITMSDRIVYCATASSLFIPITNGLAYSKIIQKNSNDKIIYEKPFGTSKDNASEINNCIQTHFDEKQIFRIDHYLSKELVRTILNIRFSNSIFETQLNSAYVEQVQIIARESIGIKGRAAYCDAYGAVKDMVQNHLLSLLALITLEKPDLLDRNSIAMQRRKVLKNITFKDGILGQCIQYKSEPGISPASKTETFAALTFFVQNNRWDAVPLYLETGKYLTKKETMIRIKFRPIGNQQEANWLTIQIAPEARIFLSLHIKSPQSRDELITVSMEFCHSCVFGSETTGTYEAVFDEVIKGDRWSAIDPEEIEYAWNIAESIQEKNLPLLLYEKGSQGPERKKLCDAFTIDLE